MFHNAISDRSLYGFSCFYQGPTLSHLFFADDSLVVCKASIIDCVRIKNILHRYELASRQKVNFAKFAITFSPNVIDRVRSEILAVMGMGESQPHDKYLGLPTVVGKNK